MAIQYCKEVYKESVECGICFKEGKVFVGHKISNVFHGYHFQCLMEWFDKSESCPLCSIKLERKQIAQLEDSRNTILWKGFFVSMLASSGVVCANLGKVALNTLDPFREFTPGVLAVGVVASIAAYYLSLCIERSASQEERSLAPLVAVLTGLCVLFPFEEYCWKWLNG